MPVIGGCETEYHSLIIEGDQGDVAGHAQPRPSSVRPGFPGVIMLLATNSAVGRTGRHASSAIRLLAALSQQILPEDVVVPQLEGGRGQGGTITLEALGVEGGE